MVDLAKFAGSIPDFYDRGMGPVLFEPYARLTAARVAAASPARVLETAAGTGLVTRRLRDALAADAELVATDLNAPMLEVARRKFEASEKVTFQPADAQNLPFPNGDFDAICCQFGVMFFPDKPRAYREARRVLRPAGRYVFSVWDARPAVPYAEVAQGVLRRAFPDDTPNFLDTPFGYSAIDPIRAALHAAGFAAITIEVLPLASPITDFRGFAEGVILGAPLAEQMRARGRDPADLVEPLAEALAQAFGAAGAMPLSALLFTACAD